ncbi:MAG: hypothetical protein M1823_005734 [Watsoniomyces obsoletus]|nr:MAG: hypothetical protein M1823_005734 [Watsoniomyces obsoletus]
MADVRPPLYMPRPNGTSNNVSSTRIGRTASMRRQSTAPRPPQASSSTTTTTDTPTLAAARADARARLERRRALLQQNRKSVGPGVLDLNPSEETVLPRHPVPSALRFNSGDARRQDRNDVAADPGPPRLVVIPRHTKARSIQPLQRDHVKAATPSPSTQYSTRSPTWSTTQTSSTSSRRMSVIPPHATGLGARTISPTDARRMQRQSMMPDRPPMPDTPQTDALGIRGPSPSMIPRKSTTPSSARNTPDFHRRMPHPSRTMSGPLPTRLSQVYTGSRLPISRARNVHSSAEEEVPPVPAIPKAYESPKDTTDRPFFTSHNETAHRRRKASADIDSLLRPSSDFDVEGNANGTRGKNLQPLRLPPLNLLPLSRPTVEKVAALQDPPVETEGRLTPHPKRGAKTPTTPMTASRATFFAKQKPAEDAEVRAARARSSISNLRLPTDTPSSSSSNEKAAPPSYSRRQVEPAPRPSMERLTPRVNGPRAQSYRQLPNEPWMNSDTGSTLRRKWSLSFRQSSNVADEVESPPADQMPPPRLPASAMQPPAAGYIPQRPALKEMEQKYADNARRPMRTQSGLPPVQVKRPVPEPPLDRDDQLAEEEMRRLASRRRDFEMLAQEMDDLRDRANPKEKVLPSQALRVVNLNIFERGEIVDYREVYFCGTQNAEKHVGDVNLVSTNFGYDDDRGDYNIVSGDHLAYRYEIIDVLGKGSFGQVVRCVDHKNGGLVAVKIIRNKKRFHQQALIEVNILRKLREWDPNNMHGMVNFTQSFYFRGHLCISTELLGMNLYEFIKSNDFNGFSLKLIRRFTKQLLSSLVLLQSHRVIHCDLKPENVLLAHPRHSEIKVIDFGSSCFQNEKVYTYIQSRFYRSPEVILGMSYGMPIDIWSLGCILAELYTGYPIFPGENEQEQLACIMEVFGPPEKHLIEKSSRKKLFFDSLGKPRLTVSSKGRRRRPSSKTLQQTLKCDDEVFVDFIARCLRWDPERRLKPDEAMQHDFITGKRTPRGRNYNGSQSQMPPPPSNTNSPVKRGGNHGNNGNHGSHHAQQNHSGARPLPDPPGGGNHHNNKQSTTNLRVGGVGGMTRPNHSPPKNTLPSHLGGGGGHYPRRHSTINGLQSNVGVKRTSTGATVGVGAASGSNLPRVMPRSMNHMNGVGHSHGHGGNAGHSHGHGSNGSNGNGNGMNINGRGELANAAAAAVASMSVS